MSWCVVLPARAEAPPGEPENSASGPEKDEEHTVVVTGARLPESQARSVIKTQVLDREDIRRSGATTLAGLLEAQPSLQINNTFRGAELWIRGLDPEYTLVLIDGERTIGRTGGAIDLARFPLDSIERVEIVRGPSSALYGSDAIGGVVNIITRESERPLEANAEARVATKRALAGSAFVAGRPTSGLGLTLSGSQQHTPAYRPDEFDVETATSARTVSSASGSAALGLPQQDRLRLRAEYTRTRLDGVDTGAGSAVFDRTQLQEQGVVSLSHRLARDRVSLQSVLQYSQFREQYRRDQRAGTSLDDYEDNAEHLGQATTTLGLGWTRNHRTTVGGDLIAQVLDSERLSDRGFTMRYAAFLEHRAVLARQREQELGVTRNRELVVVVPGVRYDLDTQFGDQVSPKLALRFDPWAELALRAGYGRGFRAPSFQELLLRFENPSVGYVVEGNPELGAESSHSFDASADYRPTQSWLFSIAGFYNSLTNMIATVTAGSGAGGTIFTYDNIDRAYTRGIEAQTSWSSFEWLSMSAGYTWMQTRDLALDRPLSGRPEHRVVARAVSNISAIGLQLSARGSLSLQRYFFEDGDADGTEERVTAPALVQIDLQAIQAFSDAFELFLGVNNLANAGDRYTSLLPRQFYAGLRGSY